MKRLLAILDLKTVFGALLGLAMLLGGSLALIILAPSPWNLVLGIGYAVIVQGLDTWWWWYRRGRTYTPLFPNGYDLVRNPLIIFILAALLGWLF